MLNEANGQHAKVSSRYHRTYRHWELQNIRTEYKRNMMAKHIFSETNRCHLLVSTKAEYSAADLRNWHIEIQKWYYFSQITTTTTTTTTNNNNNNNNNADRIF